MGSSKDSKPLHCGVIELEDAPKWDGFAPVVIEALAPPDSKWSRYGLATSWGTAPASALLPPLTGPDAPDAVVLTGSHYNTRDAPPWQAPLCEWLVAAHAAGTPRILGICYGHQVVALALGGTVDYNPGQRFMLKAEELSLTPAFAQLPCAAGVAQATPTGTLARDLVDEHLPPNQELTLPDCEGGGASAVPQEGAWAPTVRLLVSHGDCVSALPPCGVLLAHSPSCAVEAAGYGPSVLTWQAHPEFEFCNTIRDRIWPAVVGQKQRLNADEQADALASFERPRHSHMIRVVLRRFLAGW